MTARHVGQGEIFLDGEIYPPVSGSKRTLMNVDGTAADAMIFEINPVPPDEQWPLLPIAESPPQPGEHLLLIGFGKGRAKVVEFDVEGEIRFAFAWTKTGEKRWATNRVSSVGNVLSQGNYKTRSFSFDFDPPFSADSTRYEAQAAVGDSGGGVFVEREGKWLLAGMMVSVSSHRNVSSQGSLYGDRTFVADLARYREEILRWTRAACANERDDDGDERIDFPADPGCDGPRDRNERDGGPGATGSLLAAGTASAAIFGVVAVAWRRARRQGGTMISRSTRPKSAG